MTLATGNRNSATQAFTLIEVLLAVALLGLILTTSLTLLPGAIGGPSSVAYRLENLIRQSMVDALSERQSRTLEASGNRLILRKADGIIQEEDLGEEVRLFDADNQAPLERLLISPDGMHRPFTVVVGNREPLLFRSTMQIR